jgi:hypothetical protein
MLLHVRGNELASLVEMPHDPVVVLHVLGVVAHAFLEIESDGLTIHGVSDHPIEDRILHGLGVIVLREAYAHSVEFANVVKLKHDSSWLVVG